VSNFSGDDLKGDVPYREWRFEISCLQNDAEVSQSLLVQAIRKSLRGTAKMSLVSLGESASADAILGKLDSNFGDVSTNEMLMQEFYNSFQRPGESVTSFGCRLENLLQRAVAQGCILSAATNDLLRQKFWKSLASDSLRAQTRHKYDSIGEYNELLREIRLVEKELSLAPSSGTKKVSHHPVLAEDQLKELETRMDRKMDQRMEGFEKRMDSKLEDKFSLILQKLDQGPPPTSSSYNPRPQQPGSYNNNRSYNNNNRSGGGNNSNKKNYYKSRGGYQNKGNNSNNGNRDYSHKGQQKESDSGPKNLNG